MQVITLKTFKAIVSIVASITIIQIDTAERTCILRIDKRIVVTSFAGRDVVACGAIINSLATFYALAKDLS